MKIAMTILYADDDADDRELMAEALNHVDPTVSCQIASDGQQALDKLEQNDELPDFIFLDINMPVMDGMRCLTELKKDKRYQNIPVIIYSTTRDNQEINKLYRLGAASFIQKPNNFHDLCNTMNMFVKLARQ
jgi:CheY-like chemotaxis protein